MKLLKLKTNNLFPMNYKILAFLLLGLLSVENIIIKGNRLQKTTPLELQTTTDSVKSKFLAKKEDLAIIPESKLFYNHIISNGFSLPQYESFKKGFQGYNTLLKQGKIENEILTIVDFSLSSNEKRMWVINMITQEILLQTLVAHGRNSGNEYATSFSNIESSHKSSLGFYLTGDSYKGKHGNSLRLDGMEYGINHKARERAIVIHGADYVSQNFIEHNQRLGRSYGCPSVSYAISNKLIQIIKNKSVLFIYHPSRNYAKKSKLVS